MCESRQQQNVMLMYIGKSHFGYNGILLIPLSNPVYIFTVTIIPQVRVGYEMVDMPTRSAEWL